MTLQVGILRPSRVFFVRLWRTAFSGMMSSGIKLSLSTICKINNSFTLQCSLISMPWLLSNKTDKDEGILWPEKWFKHNSLLV